MIMPQRGLTRERGLIERGLNRSFTVGGTSISGISGGLNR